MLKNIIKFLKQLSGKYRPELHYMRGPGPACEKKRQALAAYPADALKSSGSTK